MNTQTEKAGIMSHPAWEDLQQKRIRELASALRQVKDAFDRAAAQGKGSKPIAPVLSASESKRLHGLVKLALNDHK
jgi:hypothetical protein